MATIPTAASPNAPDTGAIVPTVPNRNMVTAAVQAASGAVTGAANAVVGAATGAATAVAETALATYRDSAPTPNVVRADLSESTTVLALLDPSKFDDNPLNAYERPTYHLRLLAANQLEFVKRAGDLLDMNAMLSAIDGMETVVIAESGVTAGLIFQELSINTKASLLGRTRNRIAQTFHLTIHEPSTVGFLDALYEASTRVMNRNFRTEVYYIEVSFMGYQADGSRAVPLQFDQGEVSGRWLYPVTIKDMNVSLNAAGSTYDIQALPNSHMDVETSTVRKAVTIQGTTVGAMLDSLAAALNENVRSFYGTDLIKTEFKFRRHVTLEYPDPLTFVIAASDADRMPIRNFSMVGEIPQAQYPASAMISNIIMELIGSTEEGHRALNVPPPESGNAQRPEIRESILYSVETEVKSVGFDEQHNRYRQVITHHIIATPTGRPITHVQQTRVAADPAVQRAMVRAIQNRGALQKRYDYIHTGLNTEILDLDLKVKMHWYTDMPNIYGARRDQPVVETPALHNPLIHAGNDYGTKQPTQSAQQAEEAAPATPVSTRTQGDLFIGGTAINLEAGRVASERLSRLQTEARALAARSGSLTTAERARLAALNNDITRYTSADTLYDMRAYRALQDGAVAPNSGGSSGTLAAAPSAPAPPPAAPKRQPATVAEASPTPQRQQPSRRLFAEDLVTTMGKLPRSFRQSDGEPRQVFGGGLPGGPNNLKSVYGAVLDQLYSATNDRLLDLTMNIRGDPFWLGASGLSSYAFGGHPEVAVAQKEMVTRQAADVERGKANAFSNIGLLAGGDQHILLNFRYPTSINEETAVPVIRTNDIYSGIYLVQAVNNLFSKGQFTQELTCRRHPLININAVEGGSPPPGASSESPSTAQPASPPATAPAAAPAAAPTPAPARGYEGPLGVPET